jgi:prepilin-type N-terminal cleavage/methylation domain-containing protein
MYCKYCIEKSWKVGFHHSQARVNPRAGVTLAELMVVLVIICILAAIALPGLGAFSSRKTIEHQTDELGAYFHQARERAIREGVYWRIIFNPGERQWFAFGDVNGNKRYDTGEQQIGTCILQPGITFGCPAPRGPNDSVIPTDGIAFINNRINFSPMGACNAGTVYLCTSDKSVGLRLLSASGTVLIYEYISSWRLLK